MEQGSLPERYLSRSVLKHIKKQNKELVAGAAVGSDFSLMGNMVVADGTGKEPYIAWIKAMNNFSCSGGIAQGARLVIIMPDSTKESMLKSYMATFNGLAESEGLQILGGHSEINGAIAVPQFIVTIIGQACGYRHNKKAIKPGYDIVMVGETALMGIDLIARDRFEELTKRFAISYIRGMFKQRDYSVSKAAQIAAANNICYMHDVSHGGLYGALWQLGVWMNRGFLVEHFNIPIKQETIEICEFFNINPYILDGTGALIIVTENGSSLVEELNKAYINACVIGKVSEGKEKMILMNEADKRCLSPVNGDEYYRI